MMSKKQSLEIRNYPGPQNSWRCHLTCCVMWEMKMYCYTCKKNWVILSVCTGIIWHLLKEWRNH